MNKKVVKEKKPVEETKVVKKEESSAEKDSKKRKDHKLVSGYIKVFCLFAVTVIVVLLLRNWYISSVDYKMSIPVIRDTLIHEVNENELKNYIYENPNTIVYMCTAANLNCRSFEKEFNKVIENQKLEARITYLNLSNLEDVKTFFDGFNDEFPYDRILNDFPALVLFEDGQITDMANGTEKDSLNVDQAKEFLSRNRIQPGE